MGKNNPDLPRIILNVVGTDQQSIARSMKGTKKG